MLPQLDFEEEAEEFEEGAYEEPWEGDLEEIEEEAVEEARME